MNDRNIIVGILVALVAVGALLFAISGSSSPTGMSVVTDTSSTTQVATASGPNVPLAQCLKEKGVTFYGAFWCPHCKAQKALFADAVPALPYVECSTPDGNDQTQICKDKGIKSYPTWKFPDGSELTGEQQLATLAEKASCTQALPGGAPASTANGSVTAAPEAATVVPAGGGKSGPIPGASGR